MRNIGWLVVIVCAVFNMVIAHGEEEKVPEGGLKIEHFAWAYAGYMYLDGPKKEAACPIGRPGAGLIDAGGNVWFGPGGNAMTGIGGRCITKDGGMVARHFADDYWCSPFDDEEGPGSAMFNTAYSTGLGQLSESQFVWGFPLEGEAKGFLIFSDGNVVRKVYKNAEKNNRWWFKKIVGGGKKPIERTKGAVIVARDVKTSIRMVQVMPDGKIIIFAEGGFYEFKDGNLICLLGHDDYKDQASFPSKGKNVDVPTMGILGGDGTFYLCTYFKTGYRGATPCIWRIVPGGKLEAYAWSVKNSHRDGAAMYSGSMCGHHIWMRMHNYNYLPPGDLLIMAHDEFHVRRIRDGRVSTMFTDGDWREMPEGLEMFRYRWFHTYAIGPDGMTTSSSKAGAFGHSVSITYLVTGIDYEKATVGDLIESPPVTWPRAPGFRTLRDIDNERKEVAKAAKRAKKEAAKAAKKAGKK